MAGIWHKNYSVDQINERGRDTLVGHLGIEFTEVRERSLVARMPVDERTKQALGYLHGGASAAFAESIASTAAFMTIDPTVEYCLGLEINANHIGSCTSGSVTGVSTPVHLGKTTQVWETRIEQDGRLVCVSRMTLIVMKRKGS